MLPLRTNSSCKRLPQLLTFFLSLKRSEHHEPRVPSPVPVPRPTWHLLPPSTVLPLPGTVVLVSHHMHNFFSPASKARSVCHSVFSVLRHVVVSLTHHHGGFTLFCWQISKALHLWALVSLLFSLLSLLMGTSQILFGLVNKPVCIYLFLSSLMHFQHLRYHFYCLPNYWWWC